MADVAAVRLDGGEAPEDNESLGGGPGPEGAIELDVAGRVLALDPGASQLLGLDPDEERPADLATLVRAVAASAKVDGPRSLLLLANVDPTGALVLVRDPRRLATDSDELLQQREDLARIAEFLDGLIADRSAPNLEERIAHRLADLLDARAVVLLSSPSPGLLRREAAWGATVAVEVSAPDEVWRGLPPGAALGRALGGVLGMPKGLPLVGFAAGTAPAWLVVAAFREADGEAYARGTDVLASVGGQLAIALEDALLGRAIESARRRAEAVRDIAHGISLSLVPEEVWSAFVAGVRAHLGDRRLALALTNGVGEPVSLWIGERGHAAPVVCATVAGDLVARVLAGTGAPEVVAAGAPAKTEGRAPVDEALAAAGFASFVAAPLVTRGSPLGVLVVGAVEGERVDPDEVLQVEQLAAHLAPALENARSYRRVTELHAEVERIAKTKDSLAEWLVHDLRSPLATALGIIDSLAGTAVTTAEGLRAIADARGAINDVSSLVLMLLDIAALEESRLAIDRQPTWIPTLIDGAVKQLAKRARLGGVKVEVRADPANAAIDARLVGRVLTNLLSNAIAAARQDGRVRVGAAVSAQVLRIVVQDDGPGIPVDREAHLFTKYGRVNPSRQGYGLGLYFVKHAVEAHGGRVAFERPEEGGARFVCELPARAG